MEKFELPKNWSWIKCQDIVDVRDGTHDTPTKLNSGIPLITSKNLTPEGLNFSDITYISEEDYHKIEKRSAVHDDDILFAMIGTIGNPVIVKKDRPFSIKNVALFKLNKSLYYPQFFKYLLNTSIVKKQLDQNTKGGNQKFVSLSVLRNMILPLPPLEEQKRIAEILDRAEELRSKRRQAIALLDTLAQSIFLEMFGDPVSNSKRWEVKTMNECAEKIKIGPFGSQLHEKDYINNGIPLINPTHIQNGKIYPNTSLSVSDEKHQQLSQYHLQVDDVILGRRGEMGRCAIVSDEEQGWLCGTGSLFIRPKKKFINPFFLFSILSNKSIKIYLETASQGVTMANLNKTIVSQVPIILPPLDFQEKLAYRIKSIEKLQTTNQNALSELNTLFASLQHRAFRGEL